MVKEEDTQPKSEVYSMFAGMEPLQYNPFTEPAWQEAVQQYNNSMSYVDQKTVQILKMSLRQSQSNPRQVKKIKSDSYEPFSKKIFALLIKTSLKSRLKSKPTYKTLFFRVRTSAYFVTSYRPTSVFLLISIYFCKPFNVILFYISFIF